MFRKADFNAEYNATTPRPLLSKLSALGYVLPQECARIVKGLLPMSGARSTSKHVSILDIGCSYGINSAVLKFGESVTRWHLRLKRAGNEEQVALSDCQRFHPRLDQLPGVTVYGLDSSARAIAYGSTVGLLAGGFSEDLERELPSMALKDLHVDLVLCTGCIGYIGERTFSRLLSSNASAKLIFFTCLRAIDSKRIHECLITLGYEVSKVHAGLRQRAIDSVTERADAAIANCWRSYRGRPYLVADAYVAIRSPRSRT